MSFEFESDATNGMCKTLITKTLRTIESSFNCIIRLYRREHKT